MLFVFNQSQALSLSFSRIESSSFQTTLLPQYAQLQQQTENRTCPKEYRKDKLNRIV